MSDQRIEQLERELRNLKRQIDESLPVRIAEYGGGDLPILQLAQVTGLIVSGTTPHNSQTPDEAFTLPTSLSTAIIVRAVLLTAGTGAPGALLTVDNPDSLTLAELEFIAIDVRKEGLPKVGDIVRVWTSDGERVEPGEDDYDDGEGVWINQHAIYCEPINTVEELRGLDTWDLPTDQVLVHLADDPLLVWMDAAAFVSGPGGGGGGGGPTYTDGCGIIIASDVISFDRADVLGLGLQNDPAATTSCSIAVDPSALVGSGLEVAADNGTSAVKIKVKPSDLAGCGLEAASDNTANAAGPTKLKIKPADIIGDGLGLQTGNQDDGNGPCKIKVATNVTIKVPTSIELNIVGTTIEVKLNYTNYDIYGVSGSSSSMNDTVDTTDCT